MLLLLRKASQSHPSSQPYCSPLPLTSHISPLASLASPSLPPPPPRRRLTCKPTHCWRPIESSSLLSPHIYPHPPSDGIPKLRHMTPDQPMVLS
eukprot:768774-Hanusia_phi.AAC.1